MERLVSDLLADLDTGDNMMTRFLAESNVCFKTLVKKHLTPVIHFREEADSIIITVMAPDLRKEDIRIHIDNDLLTVSGIVKEENDAPDELVTLHHLNSETFKRSFRLPETVNPEQIETRYDEGVLTLKLPKKNIASSENEVSLE